MDKRHRTLRDLEQQLPNGWHDLLAERLEVDFARRTATFDVSVWVGDLASGASPEREDRRDGKLTLEGLVYCVLDPPDPTYPYASAEPAWLVDFFDPDPKMPLLDHLPAGAFAGRFFVNQWNAFIHVAASNAVLSWITH
jgi:hypothetical protein